MVGHPLHRVHNSTASPSLSPRAVLRGSNVTAIQPVRLRLGQRGRGIEVEIRYLV